MTEEQLKKLKELLDTLPDTMSYFRYTPNLDSEQGKHIILVKKNSIYTGKILFDIFNSINHEQSLKQQSVYLVKELQSRNIDKLYVFNCDSMFMPHNFITEF